MNHHYLTYAGCGSKSPKKSWVFVLLSPILHPLDELDVAMYPHYGSRKTQKTQGGGLIRLMWSQLVPVVREHQSLLLSSLSSRSLAEQIFFFGCLLVESTSESTNMQMCCGDKERSYSMH